MSVDKTASYLPDSNPKTAHGALKAPLHLIPPSALIAEAKVFGLGAKKYGAYNWRRQAVSSSVYQAAAMRHLLAWWDGENLDPESGETHLAHARACLAILIDAARCGKLKDDRPVSQKMMRASDLAACMATIMENREAFSDCACPSCGAARKIW